MAYPQTPLPHLPDYPNADPRLFEVSWYQFGFKFPEIVARITDETKARQWLHDNGITGTKIRTPYWEIDTREQNFWQKVSDIGTPIVVKAASVIPIIGTVLKTAYQETVNPVVSRLSAQEYADESLYQSVMSTKPATPVQNAVVAKMETSGGLGFDWPLLMFGLFFFSFFRAKRKSVNVCYLRQSPILFFLRRTLPIRMSQKLLFFRKLLIHLSKLQALRPPRLPRLHCRNLLRPRFLLFPRLHYLNPLV
jgi:hypothetical protein